MTFSYPTPSTGTDEELLEYCRQMKARVMAYGQNYRDSDGNVITLPTLRELAEEEARLLSRIAAASGGAVNLVDFERNP